MRRTWRWSYGSYRQTTDRKLRRIVRLLPWLLGLWCALAVAYWFDPLDDGWWRWVMSLLYGYMVLAYASLWVKARREIRRRADEARQHPDESWTTWES